MPPKKKTNLPDLSELKALLDDYEVRLKAARENINIDQTIKDKAAREKAKAELLNHVTVWLTTNELQDLSQACFKLEQALGFASIGLVGYMRISLLARKVGYLPELVIPQRDENYLVDRRRTRMSLTEDLAVDARAAENKKSNAVLNKLCRTLKVENSLAIATCSYALAQLVDEILLANH